ncbi:MAG: ankyrin repeat domain-containing protein [Bdellovibrionales bacterium]|nr:ankyrin repeat domain-containing protein [Bdellovibrionales bacterium]
MKIFSQIITVFVLSLISLPLLGQSEVGENIYTDADSSGILWKNNPIPSPQFKIFTIENKTIPLSRDLGSIGALSVREMVERSYPIDVDEFGNTFFLQSCIEGNIEKYLLFLGSVVDVNEPNNNGNTCLHLLAYGGHFAQMITVRKNGGDLTLENNDGHTPFDIARMAFAEKKNDLAFYPEVMGLLTIRLWSETSE